MAFAFTQDQDNFRHMVQRFCLEKAPTTATRKLMDTEAGYDRQVWQLICGELGLAGIHLPEEAGGSGFGAVELGIERIIHVSSVTALYNPKAQRLNEDSPPGTQDSG